MAKKGNNKTSNNKTKGPAKKKNSREFRREQRLKAKRRRQIIQSVVVLLVIGMVTAFALWPRSRGGAPVDAERLASDPSLGNTSAPITITEFADFGCPSCRAWHHSGIRERIMETYGDEVQFVWKDFPVITPFSPKAAEAGQCAFDQGEESFWAFHDLVYDRGDIRVRALKSYASQIGLDSAAFNRCLDSGHHQATVRRDMNEARTLRLRGTPSFVVNGRVLPGPPSYQQLAGIIEETLKNQN